MLATAPGGDQRYATGRSGRGCHRVWHGNSAVPSSSHCRAGGRLPPDVRYASEAADPTKGRVTSRMRRFGLRISRLVTPALAVASAVLVASSAASAMAGDGHFRPPADSLRALAAP